jgi:thioredoxin 1
MKSVTSLDEFKQIIDNATCPVIVDFTATWCGPCKAIGPTFESCSKMEECKDMIFLKVDVDEGEDIAAFCNVGAMPTFHAYYEGKLIKQFTGADVKKLEDTVNVCLATHHNAKFAPNV